MNRCAFTYGAVAVISTCILSMSPLPQIVKGESAVEGGPIPSMTRTAQATGDSLDCSQLSLKISKAYTIPEVSDNTSRLTPTRGYQLVVVELQGIAKGAMSINLHTSDFTARTTEEETVASAVGLEKKEMYAEFGVATKEAVGKSWAISGTTKDGTSHSASMEWNKQKAGVFSIAIGFSLKEHVTHFELACGKYAVGAVEVQSP